MVGDPLIVEVRSDVKLTKIVKLSKAGKKVNQINISEMNSDNILLNVQELEVEEKGNIFVWKGGIKEEIIGPIKGTSCFAVQPILDEQCNYAFDKQLILDMQVTLMIHQQGRFNFPI